MAEPTGPALWRQLQGAAGVLAAIEQGRSMTAVLGAVAAELRPGVQALSYAALRQWGLARTLRGLLVQRAPPPPAQALLGVALALLQAEPPLYDPHTLVDQAVEAAKRQRATAAQAGFINACLRRMLREHERLLPQARQQAQARWNLPDWWVRRVQADWPQEWAEVLAESTARAPMTLRVNTRRASVAQALQRLAEAGIEARPLPGPGLDQAIVLAQALPVERLSGFADGLLSVQDAAAQMAAPLLLDALADTTAASGAAAGRRLRILDACAAPGGKTAHLLERADADVTALEIDAERAQRIHQNLQRLGLSARVLCADASQPQAWWDGQPYDAVLLDAPCTASGIVRRHPDVAWLRRESDIASLTRTQARLLHTLWPLLRPGGVLLYCTCSVFRDEGQRQIETFVAHNSAAVLLPAPGHLRPRRAAASGLCQDNDMREHDGFFHALLRKAGTGAD